jgi:hypothetical protein
LNSGGRAIHVSGEGSMTHRETTDAMENSGGVIFAASLQNRTRFRKWKDISESCCINRVIYGNDLRDYFPTYFPAFYRASRN